MTNTIARRPQGPFAELVEWLESEMPLGLKRIGVAPSVPIEDFVEDDHYVVRAELPGIDPDTDVHITLDNDVLTIQGERRENKREKNMRELRYGTFTRAVRVPAGTAADQVEASYADGMLEVRVPVKGSEEPAQPISVKRGR